jgi:hypothetical protein
MSGLRPHCAEERARVELARGLRLMGIRLEPDSTWLMRRGLVVVPSAPHLGFLEVVRNTAPSFGMQLIAIPVTSRAEIERDMAAFAEGEQTEDLWLHLTR